MNKKLIKKLKMGRKEVVFSLYNGDELVTGLYGVFCQFVNEPKVYTDSDAQRKIVLGNLIYKLKGMGHFGNKASKAVVMNSFTSLLCINEHTGTKFDNIRIHDLNGNIVKKYTVAEAVEFIGDL